ncbi:DUF4179 domain-containing protein [Saccharibacillus sacchari]|uniref:DUF4179 domain-containing protein n=1 Tax=Saccharibacillus sacchari TaxID=456493 RepID=A0ACC6PGM1_9BACL
MSLYDELNDLRIDLAEYEAEALTEQQRSDWESRVKSKLHADAKTFEKRKWSQAGWLVPAVAALLLVIGATLPSGQEAMARLPFMAGLIERFTGQGDGVDYSPYKTQIGETRVNEYGELTLKELIMDTDQLMIALTFKPAEGVHFNGNVYLNEHIEINGITDGVLMQSHKSVKEADGTYTIYEDLAVREMPESENIRIFMRYDRIFTNSSASPLIKLDDPWIFEVDTSRQAILSDTETVGMDKKATLVNGEQILIKKVVVSPVSTRVYFQVLKEAAADSDYTMYGFRLIAESGKEVEQIDSSGGSDTYSYSRFPKIDLQSEKYTLIPYDFAKNKELSEGIPIKRRLFADPLGVSNRIEKN